MDDIDWGSDDEDSKSAPIKKTPSIATPKNNNTNTNANNKNKLSPSPSSPSSAAPKNKLSFAMTPSKQQQRPQPASRGVSDTWSEGGNTTDTWDDDFDWDSEADNNDAHTNNQMERKLGKLELDEVQYNSINTISIIIIIF